LKNTEKRTKLKLGYCHFQEGYDATLWKNDFDACFPFHARTLTGKGTVWAVAHSQDGSKQWDSLQNADSPFKAQGWRKFHCSWNTLIIRIDHAESQGLKSRILKASGKYWHAPTATRDACADIKTNSQRT
jgi:hypothetical protein